MAQALTELLKEIKNATTKYGYTWTLSAINMLTSHEEITTNVSSSTKGPASTRKRSRRRGCLLHPKKENGRGCSLHPKGRRGYYTQKGGREVYYAKKEEEEEESILPTKGEGV